jgi:hypothetical protein
MARSCAVSGEHTKMLLCIDRQTPLLPLLCSISLSGEEQGSMCIFSYFGDEDDSAQCPGSIVL